MVLFVFAYELRLRVLLWIAAVDRAERAVVAGCRWSRRGLQMVAMQVACGGVAMVVAGCCLSFKVRDGWCEIRVGKGLGFCVFLLGCYRMKPVFLIGLAAHLFFWAKIEFGGAV